MMTRLVLAAPFTLAAALALGGCFQFANERSGAEGGSSSSSTPTASGYYNAVGEADMLQGAMGNVTSFTQQSPEMRITGSRTSATVRIDAADTTARWWVMTNLTITGGLDHASLLPGAHLVFTRTAPSVNGLRVSALGCSGPSRPNYTYDHTADAVTVDVLPGSAPDTRRMVFKAVYTHGSVTQQVQGSFEYEPR
ncbi:MAG: hypothetical protein U0324_08940 [Polyangiales bacterium]